MMHNISTYNYEHYIDKIFLNMEIISCYYMNINYGKFALSVNDMFLTHLKQNNQKSIYTGVYTIYEHTRYELVFSNNSTPLGMSLISLRQLCNIINKEKQFTIKISKQ